MRAATLAAVSAALQLGASSETAADGSDVRGLRARVLLSLAAQGFDLNGGEISLPSDITKEGLRALHSGAVQRNIERCRAGLARHEPKLIEQIAAGTEVDPQRVAPRLVEVTRGSFEELLFRWVRLHWSVPVSAGYGRRLRFAVIDDYNQKLIGIAGLGDPVFALGPRDRFVGWDARQRRDRLKCVMDLFVLGAVPPYSSLLCGKLMALTATSSEVQDTFAAKYGSDRRSVISGRPLDGRLAMLTTTSALGRSSLYNRLRHPDAPAYISVGFTQGSGDFQFGGDLYDELAAFVRATCEGTTKHPQWGGGFRNRRELVRKALLMLGLSPALQYHGVRREVFVAPLGENTASFLRGGEELAATRRSAGDIFEAFRGRWLLPRALRDRRWLDFDPATYRLWNR